MGKEIAPSSHRVDKWVSKIEDGEIKVPPLQRPFVWKVDQIIKLLESIYNDYPIGSVLLWETNEELPSTRTIAGFDVPEKKPEYPHNYVLDGQQRLSALYGVFCKNRKESMDNPEYEIDTNVFNVSFDLDNKCFIHEKDEKEGVSYFKMKYLLDTDNFYKETSKFKTDEQKIIHELHSTFTQYEIPCVITKKRGRDEIGIIFERINNSGTPLGLFDLMVAWTWTEDFHLKESFQGLMRILDNKNFGDIQEKIILQCISCILKESSKTKVILSLDPEEIRVFFGDLVKSLELTVDYLSTELGIGSSDLLPHSHQIIPLCYFFSRTNHASKEQNDAIHKWFWRTSFSTRYSASTDSHIDEDISFFKEMIDKSNFDVFSGINYEISEEQLKTNKFYKANPYSRALIILLAKKRPLDLTNGKYIDVGEALSRFNKKEYHHIFPKDFLLNKGIGENRINVMANICILPSNSNKIILNKAPSDYFKSVIPKINYQDILESNLIPIKEEIYSSDNYEMFITERAIKIINYIYTLVS